MYAIFSQDLKYCNCPEEDCNINWNYAGYTERGQQAGVIKQRLRLNIICQCYRCNSDEEDCDGSNPGKVVNCPTDNGCLLSYGETLGFQYMFKLYCIVLYSNYCWEKQCIHQRLCCWRRKEM